MTDINLRETHVVELEAYGLTTRTINALERQNVIWLWQLLHYLPGEILAIPELGPSALVEILAAVRAHQRAHGWGNTPGKLATLRSPTPKQPNKAPSGSVNARKQA